MFLGLFFVTVGMQIDPKAVAASPLQTLLWLALFVLAKPVLTYVATRAVGYDRLKAGRAGAVLAHASELTLLIITQAMSAALLPAGPGQAMLVAAALSMGLAPIIIQHNRSIVIRAFRLLRYSRPIRPRPVAR
jgi:CPA2 family monovalent cation:H+ antiporter-2